MEQKILFLEMRFGDYIAIAKTNKAILDDNDDILKSQHGGYTDDEIYVPLIILKQYIVLRNILKNDNNKEGDIRKKCLMLNTLNLLSPIIY